MTRQATKLTVHAGAAMVVLSLAGCGASWQAPLETRSGGKSTSATVSSSRPQATIQGATYRVRRGDTLYSIAWRSGKDFRTLAGWNRIRAPYVIYPGQVLRLTPPVRHRQATQAAAPPSPKTAPPPRTATATPPPQPAVAVRPAPPPSRDIKRLPERGALHWRWPTSGKVVAQFSSRDATRQGIKISGKAGQPILAAEGGRVVYSGSGLIGYGRLIIIKHNDNYLSAYGHNAKLLVKEGATVARGAHIADMGRSNDGRAMLHFEIRRDGRPVDPARLLPRR